MTDFDYDFSDDVSLEPDQKSITRSNLDWLKFTHKGQIVRGAFVYFQTLDHNAAAAIHKAAAKQGKKATKEELAMAGKAALAKRAEELGKSLDQLSPADKLDVRQAHFKALRGHYQEGLGYVESRLGKDGPEADAVWRRLPEPKSYLVTLVLVYPTDDEGNLQGEQFAQQIKSGKLVLKPWRFAEGKVYDQIWKTQNSLRQEGQSISQKDILFECDNTQYKTVQVSTSGPATWLKADASRNAVLNAAVTMYDKLKPFRQMTTDGLRQHFGIATGSSDSGDISSSDFQDMLDSV